MSSRIIRELMWARRKGADSAYEFLIPDCKFLIAVIVLVSATLASHAAAPIEYRFTFPELEHRWMQVEATFPDLPDGTLELRMSRSSPGRYALHDFAKNVYDVHVFGRENHELTAARPDASGWSVSGHGGRVTVRYRVFGDVVDGTYLGIDPTHAHINMPAAIMWARGLDDRPSTLTFTAPAGGRWQVATQLHRGSGALEFTAPNLPYLMDSPVEFGPLSIRRFTVANHRFRFAVHHQGSDVELDAYVKDVEKVVQQEGAMFGEFPDFEPGEYTFLADYLPYATSDGMEHRNSSVMTEAASIRTSRRTLLDTVAHEFFHTWNVERIRPRSIEPFDLDRANMSGELWLAEGFTQYYGPLMQQRAGIADVRATSQAFTEFAEAALVSPGHAIRSAEDDSRMAVFRRSRFVDRPDELVEYLHVVLLDRRRDCAVARPDAAPAVRRPRDAGRLHARDVARVRETRWFTRGLRRSAVHRGRCGSAPGRGQRRSGVRARLLRAVRSWT